MQRKFLCILTVALMAVFASHGYSADRRPALLSEEEVKYYGLERAWHAQIKIDGRMTSIEHALLDRGMLLLVTSKSDLIALDAETGNTLWSRNLGGTGLLPYAPAANARAIGLVCGNEVSVLDRRNGRLIWHEVLPATPTAACQMSNDFLYVPLIDQRMACYPLDELKAPSSALLELVQQYEAIGYTLDPHSGKVRKTSNEKVSAEDFIVSQSGEKKPAPSAKLLELVDEYAAIGLVLDPYTGEITQSDTPIELVSAEMYAPLKGKMELDKLLEEELAQIAKKQRQEQITKSNGQDSEDDLSAEEMEEAGRPYYLKPNKTVPQICYSFGTAIVQPILSYESAEMEIVTWFTDRGYLFLAGTTRDDEHRFALQYRIAVSPLQSFMKESKTSKYEGTIERDVAYQPAVVQKVLDDDRSRFLVVVGSASGFVFAYDPKTSETRWWQSIGSPISNRPTVVRDKVYVPCLDGNLCCLDSHTGRVLWRSPNIGSFISASRDWIYAKSTNGELTAINAGTGAQNTLFSIKAYEDTYYNNENDRIYLITNSGLIQCLHEAGRTEPLRHTYLPEAYLEYEETDEERRQLIVMPETPYDSERRSSRAKAAEEPKTSQAGPVNETVIETPVVAPTPAETIDDTGEFDLFGDDFGDDGFGDIDF